MVHTRSQRKQFLEKWEKSVDARAGIVKGNHAQRTLGKFFRKHVKPNLLKDLAKG